MVLLDCTQCVCVRSVCSVLMVLGCTQGVCVQCVQCSYGTGLHTGCVCAMCAVFLWCYWTAHRVCTCVPQVAAKCEVTHEEQVTYIQLYAVHHCSGL